MVRQVLALRFDQGHRVPRIEGGSEAVKAESCDECQTYRKIGYQEKDYEFEPLADDLASLTLDLLMNEAGYQRSSPNPLLWPDVSREADADRAD
jgi:FdhE protein